MRALNKNVFQMYKEAKLMLEERVRKEDVMIILQSTEETAGDYHDFAP